jgi:fido (protein-threonine AMPylation protein)
VQDFLSFAGAMQTLRHSSSASSSQLPSSSADSGSIESVIFSPAKRPTDHAWELYNKTLEEFTASQIDRQIASLATNAGKECAKRAALVVERHNSALEMAMKEKKALSIDLLCSWHKELLRDLHPENGMLRTRTVRCGQTVFCPANRIRTELEMYCSGLQSLEKRLDMSKALHAILYAAVAMYGLVDIHPFLDGNGRLSRIVANYALKNLPFPISLFATPAQRAEYVLATEKTRHFLSMTTSGDVSRDELLQVVKHTGVFNSLVQLLMDRVARAALECNRVWEEKSGLAAEAAEAKAARRARERAAQGTCMICLDEKPNIATLVRRK